MQVVKWSLNFAWGNSNNVDLLSGENYAIYVISGSFNRGNYCNYRSRLLQSTQQLACGRTEISLVTALLLDHLHNKIIIERGFAAFSDLKFGIEERLLNLGITTLKIDVGH